MAIVLGYIKEYAVYIYGACALIALWYLRVAILARRERRYAVFSLEREAALNKTYGAWSAAIALLVIMGLVYLLSTINLQAIQPAASEALTVTPSPSATASRPTATPTLPLPEIVLATATPTPRPRPTLRPEPTLIPLLTPTPAVASPVCPDARAVITAPGVNAVVSGQVPIFGTATDSRFQFYKLEYAAGTNPGDKQWSYFDGGEKPVQNGRLGTLNAAVLAPGVYSIRLEVVDITGNHGGRRCQTVVVVR